MTVRIVSGKDYVAGWLDSSIHDFLGVLSTHSASTKYALITCLDSNPNPASLRNRSPELKAVADRLEIRGTGFLLPTSLLLATDSRRQVFFGFDEVWFFPTKSIETKPESVSLVGPARLNQARLNRLGKWMSANSCSMALGGGEGLNFVVRAHGLAISLLGYSMNNMIPLSLWSFSGRLGGHGQYRRHPRRPSPDATAIVSLSPESPSPGSRITR
jgi:hypothetical protein